MKTIITTVAILFVCSIYGQNFTGKAIYKTSKKSTFKISDENGLDEKMQEQIRQRMQKMNQKTFILEFDKNTSIYKEDVVLTAPKPNISGGVQVFAFSSGGADNSEYFKNLTEKRYANKTAIMGKPFLIKDALQNFNWQLSAETKNIGNYTCYKATFSKEVENVTTNLVNGEAKELKKKVTVITTAWYTLQIPISNGPKNYQGLPGLILEINDGKNTIVCTEIILNPSEKISIEEPTKGKVVTQVTFDEIKKEKNEELMEKFSGRNGLDIGNGINIKISGY